ncbi:exodeoxyribonuclease VII large subunit [Glaciecola siphonariae]|uniref:Exodeoxyribonuclease 7 large subunit n=1 Tax=Glaciecola siphonariae TaxID=521012 RepID=A0ABV9M2K0_9ALTE
MFATPSQVSILSVSKLNRFAKRVLESEIGLVWVSGEISNFVAASSGHWYFTLKDSQAQVRTAMFKGANQKAGFRPKAGDKVVVRANISLYEPRGDYQLIAQHIEPEGIGQLKQAYEALKLALQEEGLFNQEHKKPLPERVTKLGVVTSPTGAAVHDILHVLGRRNPAIEVIIYPSLVQGETAAASIVKQIEIANARNEVDVLIVGRGGGSLEDLWPFNEQVVARAIFASRLPIVSAVGHEVDVTIADFVADFRAPTPSAAAESISQDAQVLMRNIEQARQRLQQSIRHRFRDAAQGLDILLANFNAASPIRDINRHQQMLQSLQNRLNASHPKTAIMTKQERREQLATRLQRAFNEYLNNANAKHKQSTLQLAQCNPSKELKQYERHVSQLSARMQSAQTALLTRLERALGAKADLLNSVSPLATMSRGYSITYCDDQILRSVDNISKHDTVVTKLADGEIVSSVISTKPAK